MKNILFVLYFIASLLSWHFSDLAYRSLSFHARDYSYYVEFAAKITNPDLENRYSINPIGNNVFSQKGAEAQNSFHQSIHFELTKYVFYPLLYVGVEGPFLIFGLLSFLYFLPIAYIAAHINKQTRQDRLFLLLLSVIYIIFPVSMLVPGFDLRPYILLGPIFLTGILAYVFEKSTYEKIFWFNALFFVREEALIFGIIHLIFAFIISNNRKFLLSLMFFWLFWAGVITTYFVWTGYESEFQEKSLALFLAFHSYIKTIIPFRLFAFLVAITGLLGAWAVFKSWPFEHRAKYLLPIGYFSIFIPITYQILEDAPEILTPPLENLTKVLLFTPRYAIVFLLLLGLLLLIFRIFPAALKPIGNFAALILIFSLMSINFSHHLSQISYF